MPGKDIAKIERQLQDDICNSDVQVLERTNEAVKKHLFWLAGELAGTRVTNGDEINQLLHLYARVELLRTLVLSPEKFNLKELKDLFKSTAQVVNGDDDAPKADIVKAISDLDIPDAQKKQLLGKALDAARAKMEGRL